MKGFVGSLSNGGAYWGREEFIHILVPSPLPSTVSLQQVFPLSPEASSLHIRNSYIHCIAAGLTDKTIQHNANHFRFPLSYPPKKKSRNQKNGPESPQIKEGKIPESPHIKEGKVPERPHIKEGKFESSCKSSSNATAEKE